MKKLDKTKTKTKLAFTKETLRTLDAVALTQIAGGATTGLSNYTNLCTDNCGSFGSFGW